MAKSARLPPGSSQSARSSGSSTTLQTEAVCIISAGRGVSLLSLLLSGYVAPKRMRMGTGAWFQHRDTGRSAHRAGRIQALCEYHTLMETCPLLTTHRTEEEKSKGLQFRCLDIQDLYLCNLETKIGLNSYPELCFDDFKSLLIKLFRDICMLNVKQWHSIVLPEFIEVNK